MGIHLLDKTPETWKIPVTLKVRLTLVRIKKPGEDLAAATEEAKRILINQLEKPGTIPVTALYVKGSMEFDAALILKANTEEVKG